MAKDLDQDMDYGDTFISIEDEDGNEFELELLDTIAYKDNFYMCFVQADQENADDEESEELIILRSYEDENGENMLATIDDDEEAEAVFEIFMKRILEDEEAAEDEEN